MKGATPTAGLALPVIEISIHAPVKGATKDAQYKELGRENFNPRSREGSDSTIYYITLATAEFQSTLP